MKWREVEWIPHLSCIAHLFLRHYRRLQFQFQICRGREYENCTTAGPVKLCWLAVCEGGLQWAATNQHGSKTTDLLSGLLRIIGADPVDSSWKCSLTGKPAGFYRNPSHSLYSDKTSTDSNMDFDCERMCWIRLEEILIWGQFLLIDDAWIQTSITEAVKQIKEDEKTLFSITHLNCVWFKMPLTINMLKDFNISAMLSSNGINVKANALCPQNNEQPKTVKIQVLPNTFSCLFYYAIMEILAVKSKTAMMLLACLMVLLDYACTTNLLLIITTSVSNWYYQPAHIHFFARIYTLSYWKLRLLETNHKWYHSPDHFLMKCLYIMVQYWHDNS